MKKQNWVITDPSCNQRRLQIIEDEEYIFQEERDGKIFKKTLKYSELSWHQLVESCKPFGYEAEQVDKWITEGEEIPLMLECVFEMM